MLEVYRRPPDDRCPVVCVDETSKQLVSETRVPLAPVPGQPVRYDYEYRRRGVCNLFLIAAPQQGWRTVQVTARRTKLDLAAVLRDLVDVHFPQAEEGGPGLRQPQHAPPQRALRGLGPGRGAAHRQRGRTAGRDRGLGARPQRSGRARQLAAHDRGRPHQTPASVPYI